MTSPPFNSSLYDQALATLTAETPSLDTTTLVLKLRKAFPGADVTELNQAVETFVARLHAGEKLGEWAKDGHFSRSLLQQASRHSIASHRASFFRGRTHVLEIGTGTGSDTAALAMVADHVTTIDADPIASEMAQRNLNLRNITNVTFLSGDAKELVPQLSQNCDALFADPARRTRDGERVKSGDDYLPPLSYLLTLEVGTLRAIKISPGLFVEPCPSGWTRQFVGHQDECLEQTLWFGAPVPDSSIVVTDSMATWSPPLTVDHEPPLAEQLTGYLVEAHATINRSQRLRFFFHERGIHLCAHDVSYGISLAPPNPSPLLTTYRILESMPFAIRTLRHALHSRGWSNRTELKKRNFSPDLEQIRTELNLPKHSHDAPFGVVFFFRYHGKGWVIIGERTDGSR